VWGVAGESDELVEMRRVLGGQLAAFRQAAGLSQGRLAKATFCDRTSLAHIEKGRSRGDERFWTLADERCGAEGVLLAGFRAWEAACQDHEVRAREALLAEARAKAEVLRAAAVTPRPLCEESQVGGAELMVGGAPAGGSARSEGFAGAPTSLGLAGSLAGKVAVEGNEEILGQLVTLLCGWVGGMNRRELIELLGWATGAVAAPPVVGALDPEEQQRLARAIVLPSRVDERVIDHLEAMLHFCKHQENALGARAVLSTVLAQRHLVSGFLADCPATLRPRLLSVYSDMSSSVGYYFLEFNDFDSAWHYFDKARAEAHDADNAELGIHALSEMSYTASWQGKAHAGIDLAAAAQSLAGKTEDPFMRVCVADRVALASAIDGRYQACMAEYERAQDGLASAGRVPAESPAYFYSEGFLASQKSECLLRLGKPDEAAASARAGLALFDHSFVSSRAFCVLRLGKAYLESGEIDEAARVVGNAAGPIAQIRSDRLVSGTAHDARPNAAVAGHPGSPGTGRAAHRS
jgi:transcriptional regulator with XRE-family HTH domain/tetratricopeptide (TPR) repeat protein